MITNLESDYGNLLLSGLQPTRGMIPEYIRIYYECDSLCAKEKPQKGLKLQLQILSAG